MDNMYRVYCTLALALFALSSCATAPGQLSEQDFITQSQNVNLKPKDAYRNLYDGFRYCGPESKGMIFAVHYGVPECGPARDDGAVLCDIYIASSYGGRSDYAFGKVEIQPQEGKTNALLSVKKGFANQQKVFDAWSGFLEGQAKEICN